MKKLTCSLSLLLLPACSLGTSQTQLPQTQPAQGRLSPRQMKQDLDFLLATIKRCHPDPYKYIGAEAFEASEKAAYEAIERSIAGSGNSDHLLSGNYGHI